MARRLLLLLGLLLTAGCSGDKTKTSSPPPRNERLPPEVEMGPEEATRHYQNRTKR